jgi:RecB family exonuclease
VATTTGSAIEPALAQVAPRKLSAAALNRYRICPKQFWFANIERAPSDQEPGPQLAQGNAVHHALERFMGLAPESRDPDAAERALRAVWCQHRNSATFVSREEEASFGLEALRMVRRFAESGEGEIVPLAREQWLNCRLENGAVLFGKLDRVDPLDDGLTVVDYKTGERQLDENELRDELQAIVYVLLASSAYRLPVERVRYLYLRTGQSVDWCPERDDVDELQRRLLELTREVMASREWPARAGEHCRWCPFALRCTERQRVELDELIPVEDLPF